MKFLSKYKEYISFSIGFLSFVLFSVLFSKIDFHIDNKNIISSVESCFSVLNMMFSYRIGSAVYHRNIKGGISKKGNVDFCFWVLGILAFVAQSVIFFYIVGDPEPGVLRLIYFIIQLAIIVGIFFTGAMFRDKYLEKHNIK